MKFLKLYESVMTQVCTEFVSSAYEMEPYAMQGGQLSID